MKQTKLLKVLSFVLCIVLVAAMALFTVGCNDNNGSAEAETTAATETSAAIGFEPMNFVTNLQYMGTGMLTIFIVIGAIILATSAINKIFSKKN